MAAQPIDIPPGRSSVSSSARQPAQAESQEERGCRLLIIPAHDADEEMSLGFFSPGGFSTFGSAPSPLRASPARNAKRFALLAGDPFSPTAHGAPEATAAPSPEVSQAIRALIFIFSEREEWMSGEKSGEFLKKHAEKRRAALK